MNVERTELAQQHFEAMQAKVDPFVNDRHRFYTTVQQQIEAEEHYPSDPIGQEDFMYDRVYELAEQNAIDVYEAHNIFASWIMRRRPDTKVIKVKPDPIPGVWQMYE
jgi:hypothetical protein